MAEDKSRPTADEISAEYKLGNITAREKNDKHRLLADLNLADKVNEAGITGLPKLVLDRWFERVNEDWEDIKKIATTADPTESSIENLKNIGRIMWDQIDMIYAPFIALGEVLGAKAEQIALGHGVSPGAAKFINIAVDVSSGFVGTAGTARNLARSVQKLGAQVQDFRLIRQAQKTLTSASTSKQSEAIIKAGEEAALRIFGKGLKEIPRGASLVPGTSAIARPLTSGAKEAATSGATVNIEKVVSDQLKVVDDALEEGLKSEGIAAKLSAPEISTRTGLFDEVLEGLSQVGERKRLGSNATNRVRIRERLEGIVASAIDDHPKDIVNKVREGVELAGGGEAKLGEKHIAAILVEFEKTLRPLQKPPIQKFITENLPKKAIKIPPGEQGQRIAGLFPKRLPTLQETFQQSFDSFVKEMKKVTEREAMAVTAREAEKLGLTLEDVRNIIPGKAMDARQAAAYLQALDAPIKMLAESAGNVKAGIAGAPEAFATQFVQLFELIPKFRGAEVIGGRAVNILKESPPMKAISKMLMGMDPENMAKGNFAGAMESVADDVLAMADDVDHLKSLQVQGAKGLQDLGDGLWPKIRSLYTNLLLARPITPIRNAVGNTMAAMTNIAERELAGWISIDDARGVVKGEGVVEFQGMMLNFMDGMKAWGNAFRKLNPDDIGKLDFVPRRIPGPLGRLFSLPGDNLIGMDRFFKEMARGGDVYAMALRKASQEGLKGTAYSRRVAQLRLNPTQAMRAHADDVALSNTFQNELGSYGKNAQKFLQTGPLALWFPFMRTPINLVKWGFHRTPGLQMLSRSLYDDILSGGEKADMAISRLTLSNMVGQFVFGLAQQGMLTGGGPTDRGLARAWRGTHEPYSVRGAKGWFPIANTAEPGTTTIELIADFAEVMNQLDDPTIEQGAGALTLTLSRDLLDNSWWRVAGDLVDVIGSIKSGEGVNQKLIRVGLSPLINVSTGGPLGSAFARVEDPLRREVRGYVDELRARTSTHSPVAKVIGTSKELALKHDGYGDPILPPQALGGRVIGIANPFRFEEFEKDRIKIEGDRLRARLPRMPRSIGRGNVRDEFDLRELLPGEAPPIPLTVEEQDRAAEFYRQNLRDSEFGIEADLMNTQEYRDGTVAFQRTEFNSFLTNAKADAKEQLVDESLDLQERIRQAKGVAELPMLQGEERAELERELAEPEETSNLTDDQIDNIMKYGDLDGNNELGGNEL